MDRELDEWINNYADIYRQRHHRTVTEKKNRSI